MDDNYEALKSAVEFEVLAAKTNDPHVKATYLKLAQRYRTISATQGGAPASTNARQTAGTLR